MSETLFPSHPADRRPRLVLSLGAAHVAGALVGRAAASVTLTRAATVSLDPDPERDHDWPDRVAEALARLVRSRRWSGEADVLLPGHLTLTKRVRTPAVGDSSRASALLFAAQQNLPEALDTLSWDGVILGDDGAELELLLGTARVDLVESVVRAVESAGLRVARLHPPGLGPLGPWTVASDRSGMLINIGARSSLLHFRWSDGWWVRRIGFAGNTVTRLLACELDCDFAAAERLKLGGGSERADPGRAAAMRRVGHEFSRMLAQEIVRTVLAYGGGEGTGRPARVWLTGGGARLAGLEAALGVAMGCRIERAEPYLGVATVSEPEEPAGAHWADLLAAARPADGGTGARQWPDLRPWRLKLAQFAARRRRGLLLASALLALAPFTVAWSESRRAEFWAERRGSLERTRGDRPGRTADWRRLTERMESAERGLAAGEALMARAEAWPRFLAGLDAVVASCRGVWLDRLVPAARAGTRPQSPEQEMRRLNLGGRLLEDAEADTSARMGNLFRALARMPEVAAVSGERFSRGAVGELRFECVLTLREESLL